MRIGYVIAQYGAPRLAERAAASIERIRPDASIVVEVDSEGRGYSAALNSGISALPDDVEIVCCLNSDVEMLADDRGVETLFNAHKGLAIVGPRQIDADDLIVHGGIVPDEDEDGTAWDLDLRHRCWHQSILDGWADGISRDVREVPMVAGSVLYVDRTLLHSFGGWPEWTRFYYEDMWLCYLARHRGYRVLYDGETTWRHLHECGSDLSRGERIARMDGARERFIYQCGRAGIPLRFKEIL